MHCIFDWQTPTATGGWKTVGHRAEPSFACLGQVVLMPTFPALPAGVVLGPGRGFGPGGKGYVRFALVHPEDRLKEAAARIAAWLKDAKW